VAGPELGHVVTSAFPAFALQGGNLFFGSDTSLGPSGVVSLSRPVASPSASKVLISNLPNGKPRLSFRVNGGGDVAAIHSITIDPPAGLRFAGKPRTLAKNVSITGAGVRSLRVSRGRLTFTVTRAKATITIRAKEPTLLESAVLRRQARRKHGRKPILATRIQITQSTGDRTLVTQTNPA